MKFWKKLPSWLKGGILGAIAGLVIFSIIALFIDPQSPLALILGFPVNWLRSFGNLVDDYGCPLFSNPVPGYCSWLLPLLMFLSVIIAYSIIGILIGWTTSKIKNKKLKP